MGGRPRKPTQVLKDKGAFDKNPSRGLDRAFEPKSNGPIGDAPKYFDQAHQAIWQEYVEEAPRGVLTKADRKLLELAVRLTYKMRFDEFKAQEVASLASCLQRMGLTPSDRSKVQVEPEKQESRFAAIAATLGASTRPQ